MVEFTHDLWVFRIKELFLHQHPLKHIRDMLRAWWDFAITHERSMTGVNSRPVEINACGKQMLARALETIPCSCVVSPDRLLAWPDPALIQQKLCCAKEPAIQKHHPISEHIDNNRV